MEFNSGFEGLRRCIGLRLVRQRKVKINLVPADRSPTVNPNSCLLNTSAIYISAYTGTSNSATCTVTVFISAPFTLLEGHQKKSYAHLRQK